MITDVKKIELQFGGVTTEVAVDELGRWSLNDLHKASGGSKLKEVSRWRKLAQTQEMVDILQDDYPGVEVIASSRGGKTPGTFVAPELAVDYASWVSPHFRVATTRVIVTLARRGYVVADRYYNVADVVRMYRHYNGSVYADQSEPLEGHNDVEHYGGDTTLYRKAREIGKMRLARLSKRQWAHMDDPSGRPRYLFITEGGDGEVDDVRYNSWCASRYYFVRVDEVYNLIDMLFGDEIGNFAPEWLHREEHMLDGLERYTKEKVFSAKTLNILDRNGHEPATWGALTDNLYSDED